jgi:hypothetical protein
VQGVKDAGLEAISKVPGFSKAMATKVLVGLGIPVPADPDALPPANDPEPSVADAMSGAMPDASSITPSTPIESTAQ